ncbi:hypothetical protein CKAN_00521900 [Cinnamomum micranthum f. kanehirae]|uniref:GRF-type domain-containing protein n=1 Tax=Cinnamomum micranthum f. kanehirae TaxID=337451 RepID=A0A443NE07_9MAGN|nr:hypothetical protein CKAN_00521900 [Cinnamomum micranthum f. kanehirae]
MSSSNTTHSECPPKCRCGAGEMKLFTSRTQLNPHRKFWKCPNWKDENGCGAFLWKDEVAHWQLAEANSMTCERENLVAVVEKLESALCVFIEVEKIRNAYLRKIYHAIIVACCIVILVFLFSKA